MGSPNTDSTTETDNTQIKVCENEEIQNNIEGEVDAFEDDSSDDSQNDFEVTVNSEICNSFCANMCSTPQKDNGMLNDSIHQSQQLPFSDGGMNSSKSGAHIENCSTPLKKTTSTSQGLCSYSKNGPPMHVDERSSQANFGHNMNFNRYDYSQENSQGFQNHEYACNNINNQPSQIQIQQFNQPDINAAIQQSQQEYSQCSRNSGAPFPQPPVLNNAAYIYNQQNIPTDFGPTHIYKDVDRNYHNSCSINNSEFVPPQAYVSNQYVNPCNFYQNPMTYVQQPEYEYGRMPPSVQTASAVTPSGQKVFIPLDDDKYEVRKHVDEPTNCVANNVRAASPRPVQIKGSLSNDDITSDAQSCSSGVSMLSGGTSGSSASYDSTGHAVQCQTVYNNGVVSMHGENMGPLYSSNVLLPDITYTPNNFQQQYPIQMTPEDFFQTFSNVPPPPIYNVPTAPVMPNMFEPQPMTFANDSMFPMCNGTLSQMSLSQPDLSQCSSLMAPFEDQFSVMPLSQPDTIPPELAPACFQQLQTCLPVSQPVNNITPMNYASTSSQYPQPCYPNMAATAMHPGTSEPVFIQNGYHGESIKDQIMTYLNSGSEPISLSPTEAYMESIISNTDGIAQCIPQVPHLIDPDDGLAYPALHVSEKGVITVLLRKGVSLEMTADKSLRLAHHKKELVVAINENATNAYVSHPAGTIHQNESVIDMDMFLKRRAKLTADSVEFGNDFKTFKIDDKMVDQLRVKKGHFRDIDVDESLNFISTNQNFYNCDLVARCTEIASDAYFEKQKTHGCKVVINGTKIVQNNKGDVSVFCGPVNFLRMSPSTTCLRIKTENFEVDVGSEWNIRLLQGRNLLKAGHVEMIACNGKIEAGLNKDGRFAAFSLPDRRRLRLGQKMQQRRPGVMHRPRFPPFRHRLEPEWDHWAYTRRF